MFEEEIVLDKTSIEERLLSYTLDESDLYVSILTQSKEGNPIIAFVKDSFLCIVEPKENSLHFVNNILDSGDSCKQLLSIDIGKMVKRVSWGRGIVMNQLVQEGEYPYDSEEIEMFFESLERNLEII